MKYPASRRAAFTLMEIMIVCGVIGLLAAIAVPTFMRARDTAQVSACINNLRQISGAKQVWAIDNLKDFSDVPQDSDLFGVSLYLAEKPVCPSDGTYSLNSIGESPTCSVAGHSL